MPRAMLRSEMRLRTNQQCPAEWKDGNTIWYCIKSRGHGDSHVDNAGIWRRREVPQQEASRHLL